MNGHPLNDVIAAIATPPGKGAIGIVRLSGADVISVLTRVFKPRLQGRAVRAADDQPRCVNWVSHTMYHGYIYDGGNVQDEVLCCIMRAPRSYTREDVAEIYAHGGMSALRGVLETVLKNGARPAEPGEFTKRAFLNGRMDLTQAEAVMSVINAKTDAARTAGLRQLGGGLRQRIEGYRDSIIKWLAHIELSIDYPEHGDEAMNLLTVQNECIALIRQMEQLLATARIGRIITEGVRTVIIGRPNVGKSSLMNAILQEDRAIVTDIPGTTRDALSEAVSVQGVPLLLTDTAGIRETDDRIEKMGVDKSLEQAERAELILFTADRSVPPQPEDVDLWARLGGMGKDLIVVLNKCDLPPAEGWLDEETGSFLGSVGAQARMVKISAKTGTGLDNLYKTVESLYLEGLDYHAVEADLLTRERHRYLLYQAIDRLRAACTAAESGVPEDLVAVDLTAAYRFLGEMTGAEIGEEIIDRIFSEFCVGK